MANDWASTSSRHDLLAILPPQCVYMSTRVKLWLSRYWLLVHVWMVNYLELDQTCTSQHQFTFEEQTYKMIMRCVITSINIVKRNTKVDCSSLLKHSWTQSPSISAIFFRNSMTDHSPRCTATLLFGGILGACSTIATCTWLTAHTVGACRADYKIKQGRAFAIGT